MKNLPKLCRLLLYDLLDAEMNKITTQTKIENTLFLGNLTPETLVNNDRRNPAMPPVIVHMINVGR